MESLVSFSFWFSPIYFFISMFLAFYMPGDLLIRYLKISRFQKVVIGTILGMVLFAWQGVIFGYLHLRMATYCYVLIACICWVMILIKDMREQKQVIRVPRIDLWASLIILLGISIQVYPLLFVGVQKPEGLYFCCGNNGDNLYYLTLTNQISKQFPPFEPGMYGVVVHNYHYWSNVVIAELQRVFALPFIQTQFQYAGFFLSLFVGLSAIVFSQLLRLNKAYMRWLLFFLYFGGDALLLILILFGKGWQPTTSSLEDGTKFLQNLPRAYSVVVLFCGINLFLLWIKKKDMRTGLLMALMLGSVIGFKVYTGLFVLSGLAVLGVSYIFLRIWRALVPILLAGVLSACIYLPVNTGAGGLYYTGFWRFENFIAQPNIGLSRMALAFDVYKTHHNILRIIEYELLFFLLYTVGIFGTKLICFLQTRKSLALIPRELHVLLLTGLSVSLLAGFFFEQTSGEANTFNFLVSVFIFSSIYAALACSFWMMKLPKALAVAVGLLVVFLTIPRSIAATAVTTDTLSWGGFIIPNGEIEGYRYLNTHGKNHALVLVSDDNFPMNASAPYVSFLTDDKLFLSGKGMLESHGIDISGRSTTARDIFTNPVTKFMAEDLKKTGIDYLVINRDDAIKATFSAQITDTVFRNKDIRILRVSQERIVDYLRTKTSP